MNLTKPWASWILALSFLLFCMPQKRCPQLWNWNVLNRDKVATHVTTSQQNTFCAPFMPVYLRDSSVKVSWHRYCFQVFPSSFALLGSNHARAKIGQGEINFSACPWCAGSKRMDFSEETFVWIWSLYNMSSKVNISELSQAKNLVHVLFDADFAEGLISQGWGHKFYLLHFYPSAPLGRSSYPGAEGGPGEILVSEQFQHLSLMRMLNRKWFQEEWILTGFPPCYSW